MPSRDTARSSSPGNALKSKELNRLLKLSNGAFTLGNNNANKDSSRGNSENRPHTSNENKTILSSVSKLLSSSRPKSKSRSRKHSVDNDSMVSGQSSFTGRSSQHTTSRNTDDIIERRGRKHSSNRKSSISSSKLRSRASDNNATPRKSRHSSRSKSRARNSSAASVSDSITMITAESLENVDVNIATAKSLILKRSMNGSVSGKSIQSNSGRNRSRSGMKSRKSRHQHDDSSSVGANSVLSDQLSMISNLEELSALDATVISASESHERTRYSRRSASSSRAHSRSKGGRSEFSKSRSRRHKKSSTGSVTGSVCTSESMSVKEILNELRSTATSSISASSSYQTSSRSGGRSRSAAKNAETSQTLNELLRQSRDVLKEASDFRALQSQPMAISSQLEKPTSIGRSKSDMHSSNDANSLPKPKSTMVRSKSHSSVRDAINQAEHSFLDSLVESFNHGDDFQRTGPSHLEAKNSSNVRGNSGEEENKEGMEWSDQTNTDFFSDNFDASSFNNNDPFGTSFGGDSKERKRTSQNNKNDNETKDRSFEGSASGKDSKLSDFENSFTTSFDPWSGEIPSKPTSELTDKMEGMTINNNNSNDPFVIDTSFGTSDGWSSLQNTSTDVFDPFLDETPNQDETFNTHEGEEDARNLTVLSYSRGEDMNDFFGDMNLDGFLIDAKPTDEDDNDANHDEAVHSSLGEAPKQASQDEISVRSGAEESEESDVEIKQNISVPFDESFERSEMKEDHVQTKRSVHFSVPDETEFIPEDEPPRIKSTKVEFDDTFKSSFPEEIGSTPFDKRNKFEVEEKAKFMMGFLSDFPSSSFDAWDSTDIVPFDNESNTLVDEPSAFGYGKKLSFGSIAEEEQDSFETENREVQVSKTAKHSFFTNNGNDQNTSDFFSNQYTFDESFSTNQQFGSSSMTNTTSKSKMKTAITSTFDPWGDDWEPFDNTSSKRSSAVGSCAEFSTDTTESPTSVINEKRIFIKS